MKSSIVKVLGGFMLGVYLCIAMLTYVVERDGEFTGSMPWSKIVLGVVLILFFMIWNWSGND